MAKPSPSSIATKIFIPVASSALIALGSILYQGYQERLTMREHIRDLNHKIDSFIVVTNGWVAHLDQEMAEQQQITKNK